ncbi:MAG: hypothetical protein R3C28_08910 [Pirellulaceae bacterium]
MISLIAVLACFLIPISRTNASDGTVLAQTQAESSNAEAERIATPKILAILKRGKASELKRVLVKMQDNRALIICFRAEEERFYITSENKSQVW